MAITLKPLTAIVTRTGNIATIQIKNDSGELVLTQNHFELHTMFNPIEVINDNLDQMRKNGLNIVSIDTEMPGIALR